MEFGNNLVRLFLKNDSRRKVKNMTLIYKSFKPMFLNLDFIPFVIPKKYNS